MHTIRKFKPLGFVSFSVFVALLLAALFPATAHAARWFYDNTLGEVSPEEKVVPSEPAPVQLLFEFQRDGEPNPKATKQVKPWAFEDIANLAAFSEVVETPVDSGAVLSIRFNNVVDKEELAKVKKDAFGAGLGLGIFGSVAATDYYFVSFDYVSETGATPISTEVQHALHMTYGKSDTSDIPGTRVKNAKAAVQAVVRQALNRGVNNIFAEEQRLAQSLTSDAALDSAGDHEAEAVGAAISTAAQPVDEAAASDTKEQ